jgi:hypothetical protein
MRIKTMVLVAVLLMVVFMGSAYAQQDPIEKAIQSCQKEIDTYCKNVSPGEGRLYACLYAYEDKLSGRCEYALYDVVAQLERAVNALGYVANECRDDLKSLCSSIEPGEGRLYDCLEKNDKKVSPRCRQAVKDVGLTRVPAKK